MIKYHVILIDELGEEFSVTISLPDNVRVQTYIAEQYPECMYSSIRRL